MEVRNYNSVTQEQLANDLNLAKSTISSYENARSQPDIEILISYSKRFNVSIDYLLCQTDNVSGIYSNVRTKENNKKIKEMINDLQNMINQ